MNRAQPRDANALDGFIGQRIALHRAMAGVTQTDLAKALGVSFQQLQKYESAQNRIQASRLFEIATALGRSVLDFYPEGDLPAAQVIAPLSAPEQRLVTDFKKLPTAKSRRAVAQLVAALSGQV